MKDLLLSQGTILQSGEISKDKINVDAGAITQPFAEMVWVTTGGDMETGNRLTEILVSMNTPRRPGQAVQNHQAALRAYGGLCFSEEAEPMNADPNALEYFIFSFTADFGEVMQYIIADEKE